MPASLHPPFLEAASQRTVEGIVFHFRLVFSQAPRDRGIDRSAFGLGSGR